MERQEGISPQRSIIEQDQIFNKKYKYINYFNFTQFSISIKYSIFTQYILQPHQRPWQPFGQSLYSYSSPQ